MSLVHNFKDKLDASNSARLLEFWEATYRAAFPDFRGMVDNARDNGAQRCGIDRLVFLKSTQVLRIDEKARFKDYGDFLIEYGHTFDSGKRARGWIEKDLTIDFLAYGIVPSRRCYIFPWPLLRSAWVKHGPEWKRLAKSCRLGFECRDSRNTSWVTHNIAVPYETIREAISDCLVVDLGQAAQAIES